MVEKSYENYIQAEDFELWMLIKNGPHIPKVDALQIAHEGTNQVKQSRIELLMRKYELFEMGDRETIMDMYTRFTQITNELKSLGKTFTTEELVRKI